LSNSPATSVVMSVFNASQYLSAAVESILAQSLSDFEFIIIDDGSSDSSLSILRKYESGDSRIRVISQQNAGLTKALNIGISQSRGEFVARMDADDIAMPNRLVLQTDYLKKHPECVAVGSHILLADPDGDLLMEEEVPHTHEAIVAKLQSGVGAVPHPTALIRSDALRSVGGYRESFTYAQDLDLWLRLAEVGRLANLPQALLQYRLHPNSITSRQRTRQIESAERAVREAYQRTDKPLPADFHIPCPPNPSAERTYRSWARMAWRSGNLAVAHKHAWNAFRLAPFSLSNLGIARLLVSRPPKAA